MPFHNINPKVGKTIGKKGWNLEILLVSIFFAFWSCQKLEDQQPKSQFELEKGPLPIFNISLDSTGSKIIRFDSIAQGGDFFLQFTPFKHCEIKIVEDGKAVSIQAPGGNWKDDQSNYTICKNNVCRNGTILMSNNQFVAPPDTNDTTGAGCKKIALRNLNIPFKTSTLIKGLFPQGVSGTLDSVKSLFYGAFNQGDTCIRYYADLIPGQELWGWDTVTYKINGSNGRCYFGKIALVLGDPCWPVARQDVLYAAGGVGNWNNNLLVSNDKSCNQTIGLFATFTTPPFNYAIPKTTQLQNGILTEVTINQTKYYQYQRTNPTATKDRFVYYLKDYDSGNRVTKAWVNIIIN